MPKPSMAPTISMNDFVRNWDAKITKIVASFGIADHADDVKQEIYLDILKLKEGKNGLERYDAKRAAFSTYVYQLILVKVRNYRSRVIRQHLWEVSESSFTSQDPDAPQQSPLDRSDYESQDNVEISLQLENLKNSLKHYPSRSFIFRDGECISRDLLTLFECIMKDMSRQEIKEFFDYSTGSIGAMFEQLRDVPELLELVGRSPDQVDD